MSAKTTSWILLSISECWKESLQQIQLLALAGKVMTICQNMKQMLKYLCDGEISAEKIFPQKN